MKTSYTVDKNENFVGQCYFLSLSALFSCCKFDLKLFQECILDGRRMGLGWVLPHSLFSLFLIKVRFKLFQNRISEGGGGAVKIVIYY